MDPVRCASQRTTHLIGKRTNNAQPTQIMRIHKAVSPDAALTSATLSASSVHPTRSLATPALSTTTPTVVSSSLSSKRQPEHTFKLEYIIHAPVRMQHRTGKAAMENTTPTKRKKHVNMVF